MEFWSAFLLALLFVCFLSWRKSSKPRLNLPPSPTSLPIIGHIHHLITSTNLPHKTLMELSKRYGSLMFLQLGAKPTVVVSSPKIAKEVLLTNDSVFASKPKIISLHELLYSSKSIATTAYGQHWKDMRKLCTVELFSNRRLETFTCVLEEELTELLGGVILAAARNDELVSIRKCVRGFTFNTVTRILMSKSFFGTKLEQYGAEEARQFVNCLDDVTQAALQLSLGDFFPNLAWVDQLWKIPHMRRLHSKMDKFLQQTLVEHRRNGHASGDIVDVLDLHFGAENEDYTKATLLDLTIGGTDTSSAVIEWALAELLNNPDILARVQRELDTVVGTERLVKVSDIPKLDYLNAVIKESFRLHPSVPLDVRSNTCDVKVDGYDIPKDSLVYINAYAIGRHAQAWENPDVFDPERFKESSINVFGHDPELIPFGAGRRMCAGIQLGLRTVQLTLANMLHGFDWRLPQGQTKHPMLESFGGTTYMADPLVVNVASPRLVEKLYF